MPAPSTPVVSCLIRVRGTVQGVGFRPFVYRLALRLGIKGEVKNDGKGVAISALGPRDSLDLFVKLLKNEAPPLSAVRSVEVTDAQVPAALPAAFTIAASAPGGTTEVDIACDVAVCEACLREMRDPADRRFGHAFINCTDCGPRYTVITALPYDRPNTTMANFPLCPACRAEYDDPASRRFHAQPVCCPECGPRLALLDKKGKAKKCKDPVAACIKRLKAGQIVAIKGIGGFHLACRPDIRKAVLRLRKRKDREEKPFALMARDRHAAEAIVSLSGEEARLLESDERPIVLATRLKERTLAVTREVAPCLPTFGVMLPCAPLHHLIFDRSNIRLLVMTSANRTDEPMVHTTEEAVRSLRGIADAFLTHDRPIAARTDDSIARVAAGAPLLLRRSRGFVPDPLPCPCDVRGIVGCGGVLKSSVAVGRGSSCYVSQYVGNADNAETLAQLDTIKNHLLGVLSVTPSLYVADLHPGTLSSRIADSNVPLVRVQHHHAHAAACMAENNITGKAVCVVYDGTGYGEDGTLWGGEFFAGDYAGFVRAGHLAPMLLPGADAGIRNPWRMAMGALFPHLGGQVENLFLNVPKQEKRAVAEMLAQDISCVKTSGMGRLFDAMSALLGICALRSYEGQPAIMLEATATRAAASGKPLVPYDLQVATDDTGTHLIDGSKIILAALRDFHTGARPSVVAARFHATIAHATALVAGKIAGQTGTDLVCLSGGCFQNALLLEQTVSLLRQSGLTPVVHRLVPPNDESISYGQVVIAGTKHKK
jgi:hydrogenase maturation protein HypF